MDKETTFEDANCEICHERTDSFAGDPGRWPTKLFTHTYHWECAHQAIENSHRPTGGWVPVTERLPEIGEEYNVVWDLEDGHPPVVTTFEFDFIRKIWFDHDYPDGAPGVLAWQPLPAAPGTQAPTQLK